jgi:cyclopropane-fatty-acyl-phospholipid synthase
MNSRIFTGQVMHQRLEPIGNQFVYPIYFYAFDLDELPRLSKKISWFGYNQLRPVSIWDKDYLDHRPGSIRSKLLRFLEEKGLAEGVKKIELVTSARFFNYVFNPVSFYYCYNTEGVFHCAVAEVNNTFGERHLYVLGDSGKPRPGFAARYTVAKEFHVSPFNDMKGDYDFHFSSLGEGLDIRINIVKEGLEVFHSRMWGKSMSMTNENLSGTIVRYPFTAALTLPRILWQAGKLYWKGLKVFTKPHPSSEMTIQVKAPSLFQRLAMKMISRKLQAIRTGCLTLVLPDQSLKIFGDPQAAKPLQMSLKLKTWDFFIRIALGGDLALGETYAAGDWDTNDLPGVLKLLSNNWEGIVNQDAWTAGVGMFLDRIFHLSRKNSINGSRKNIREHYDLSNDFFQTFLDGSMTYSSAVYETADQSLEEAQINKIQMILRKARLGPTDHLLEIGSGWGALSIRAAQQTGCRVTTVTVSEEQFKLASERVQKAGLSGQIEVKLCDYRLLKGQYDKIVSVEMLEAVGHENYGDFFKTCDRLLKPNGLVVIQVISMPDQRYDEYLKRCDFIQKHIFPGSVIPSLKALNEAMVRHSHLLVEHLENIGPHYARTLADWTERFEDQRDRILGLGFSETFYRKWLYYFAYCEAGFETRALGNLHLVLTRAQNRELSWSGQRTPENTWVEMEREKA